MEPVLDRFLQKSFFEPVRTGFYKNGQIRLKFGIYTDFDMLFSVGVVLGRFQHKILHPTPFKMLETQVDEKR